MRLIKQGRTVLTQDAATEPQQLITTANFPAGKPARYVWLGAGSTNVSACHVGLNGNPADLAHYLANDDQKGFEIEHDCPNDLFVIGAAGAVVKWAIYG